MEDLGGAQDRSMRCRILWTRVDVRLTGETDRTDSGALFYASISGPTPPLAHLFIKEKGAPTAISAEKKGSFYVLDEEMDQQDRKRMERRMPRTPQPQQQHAMVMPLIASEVSILDRVGIGALAGGVAGGFTNVVLHPIDTVKTKLQTRGSSSVYSGPVDVVRKVLASQGIWGFFTGVQAALVGSVMSSAIYFGTYELAKSILANIVTFPSTVTPPLAAALGNITSSAILVPKEVVKQRMQAGAVGSAREVFLHTLQSEGVLGLYAGYSAALLRNLPSNMISFSTFEYLKMAWLNMSGVSVLAPWQSVVSGALAGALSAAVTTPLDVVKTRLMTQARAVVTSSGMTGVQAEAAARAQTIAAYTYKGVSSTMQQICKEEGLNALLKGMTPRIFYSACFSALGFCVFETTRTFFLLKYIEHRKKAAASSQLPTNV